MKIAVIGAGASGLMAAYRAGLGNEVFLFEKNEKTGKKIYITGKGRCNVTNDCMPDEFLENVVNGKKFLMSAIHRFTPKMTVDFLAENGVKTKVERGNRVFPQSDKSSDIIAALNRAISKSSVKIIFERVISISRSGSGFSVVSEHNDRYFDKVILACGGVSYPLTGSTGDGYEFAKKLGHSISGIKPALVPVLLREDVTPLEGLSLKNVSVKIVAEGKTYSKFGEMLFTHDGVSGPVVLSLSSLINKHNLKNAVLHIDLKPALTRAVLEKRVISDLVAAQNKQYKNSLDGLLPKKLIDYFIKYTKIDPEKRINILLKEERDVIVDSLKNLCFHICGLDDVSVGIVTSGGVSLSEINPKTMESKIVSGLYFAGEMMDVDAFTGGFNMQIAFSTGFVAGEYAGGNK